MAKLKPTTISYKDNFEDKLLRQWVHSHSNYSGFVKDVLRAAMKNEKNRNSNSVKPNKESELIDLGDF